MTAARENEWPEGWEPAALAAICQLNPAKPSSDAVSPDSPVTFVPMPAVDADAGAIAAPETRAFAEVRRGFTSFRDGDVIMAKITPCMENGKAAVAHGLENGLGFGSTEFHVLRPSDAVLAEYVYHFIRQESFREAAAAEMTGSVGQKRVPAEFLRQAEIPLPPLAEQKRIVAKVEQLLGRVREVRDRLARVPLILKRFRQSVLAAACSGRLTADWRGSVMAGVGTAEEETDDRGDVPPSWSESDVASVCTDVVDCPHSTPKWVERGEMCLRTTNFRPGHLDLGEVRFVSPETFRNRRLRLEPRGGDVVYSREGGILGIACMIPAESRVCLGQRMMLMRPGDTVLPAFLMHVLNEPATLGVVRDMTGGSSSPHLNVGDIKRFRVPLPPVPEQQEIVRRVEGLFNLADAIEQRVALATRRADQITQAILAKAFRGELVPTEADLGRQEGRDYEPASDLLARVRAHESVEGGTSVRRRARRSSTTG